MVATLKTICLLLAASLLLACSPGDSGKLPPVRPAGTLSGQAMAGPIVNAQVTVYGFGDGRRGTRLGNTLTDADGEYSLDIRAPSQVVLVEVRGGRYVEEASNASVELADGQVLRAVGRYQSGRPLRLMVTPLTHMVVALAEHKLASGMAIDKAIDEANSAIQAFFTLDVQATPPAPIAVLSENGPDATELYALYLAGLSHWSQWFAQGDASQWNSITLAQTLYQDLRADGLLDGLGDDPATPLGFGTVALDGNAYRLAFSQHMLAFAQRAGIDTDKLLAAAQTMAAQTTLLPDGSEAVPLDGQAPRLTLQQLDSIDNEDTLLSLEEFADKAHSGTFMLQSQVSGLLGAKRLTISIVDGEGKEIDEVPQEYTLRGNGQVLVIVDTTDYDDGEYTFTVSAEDILGKTTAETFRIQFDNTAPTISLTSPSSSNQATMTLTGTFADNIAGLAAIRVNGQEAILFTDGTWQIDVELTEGANTFSIEVEDQVGNSGSDLTATVYLDNMPPVIDSANRHGPARLSNGDGSASDPTPLQDSNGSLYFESDGLDLGGTLLDRFALNSAGIPYFAFAVSDDTATGVPTADGDIRVRMQYRHNDQVLSDWQPLTPVGGEYLVPLVSEVLGADWHRATPSDQHIIAIEVSDPAGNTTTTQFDFYTDVYVPAFDIANDNGDADNRIDDLPADIFDTTAFADRASLDDTAFSSIAYTFRNTTGKSFYLSLADDSLHTTEQIVDKLVREQRVRLVTTTEWRIGLMTPTDTSACPDFDEINGAWTATSSIWNWDGSGWVEEKVPDSTYGAEENIQQDAFPPAPAASPWSVAPDFDAAFKVTTIDNSPISILTYGYDYLLSLSITPDVGWVKSWIYQDLVGGTVTSCNESRHFQQRETYAYESVPGYPMDVLSTETLTGPTFVTTGYRLMDNDTVTEITPVNGWYAIPAGHSVTIEKTVTTPALPLHEDDLSGTADYTPRLKDKTITWSVDRRLGLTVVHDAGEANIDVMPARRFQVGAGSAVYQISR